MKMLANHCRGHNIKFFESYHEIQFTIPGQVSSKMNEKIRCCFIRQRDYIVQTIARPIFLKHLFFGNQDDVTAATLAFANKVAAFEVTGQAHHVQRASLRICNRESRDRIEFEPET